MRILIVGASSGIGRGPALGGIPSSKESLSVARGVSAEARYKKL